MGQAGKQPTKGKSKREPVNICTNGSQFQCLNTKVKRKMTVQKHIYLIKQALRKINVNYEFTMDGKDGE